MKIHLGYPSRHKPLRRRWTTCGVYALVGLKTTDDWKEVTCGNCKRTNVYRMRRMGVKRAEWGDDV